MKKQTKKNILLITTITLITLAIIYLESQKVHVPFPNQSHELQDENELYPKAPEFTAIEHWINSEPLTMQELKGKVVLIDIWTYSCINCIRTLPYIKSWHETYKDDGLVIIGVHTPEFAFEKKLENVQDAVNRHELTYPIALDNNYGTWQAYQNRYWPRKYLIDIDGNIRYDHAGEGAYEQTEKVIQELLNERKQSLGDDSSLKQSQDPQNTIDVNFRNIQTPEIYFGVKFFRGNIGNPNWLEKQQNTYTAPLQVNQNTAYLQGEWITTDDYSQLLSNSGKVVLRYNAKAVNIVAGSDNLVKINIQSTKENSFGKDTEQGVATIHGEKIYNIISADEYAENTIILDIQDPGLRLYTFTFG